MKKVLIIQTAFIGDVILATPLIEVLKNEPNIQIDFLLRAGNESLLSTNPHVRNVLIWNKKTSKYKGLLLLIKKIRKEKYDVIYNCQRFLSSGLVTAFSNAKIKIGFDKNPLSFLFTKKIKHIIDGRHEVQRNLALIDDTITIMQQPKLYLKEKQLQHIPHGKYVCMAPASVWKTKALPINKWIALCDKQKPDISIYLLGAKNDVTLCKKIQKESKHSNIIIKAGELDLLSSAAIMSKAEMNYVNDSAPLHLASAMNAPCTAFFCSTLSSFGFYPLSQNSQIKEVNGLACRPCGLHGFKECPKGHFKCGDIHLD